jgi:putative spermidine/putrescine transport system substrate-binding protein
MATGGAWQAAQRQASFEPFAKETGVKFNEQEYLGDLGKIRAMVETGDVPVDLVTVETATVLQGCDSGILQRLDYSKIADRSKFLPGTALDCGIGLDVYGDVLAYDSTVLKDPPTSVLDIFDTKRFPGKRALRKFPAQNLEWALMADGVAPADVYRSWRRPRASSAPSASSTPSRRTSSGGMPAPSRRSFWPHARS